MLAADLLDRLLSRLAFPQDGHDPLVRKSFLHHRPFQPVILTFQPGTFSGSRTMGLHQFHITTLQSPIHRRNIDSIQNTLARPQRCVDTQAWKGKPPRREGAGTVEDSVMMGQDGSSTHHLRRQEPRKKEWASSYKVEWARKRRGIASSLTESPDRSLNPSTEHNQRV